MNLSRRISLLFGNTRGIQCRNAHRTRSHIGAQERVYDSIADLFLFSDITIEAASLVSWMADRG